jgi:hypothetical protein
MAICDACGQEMLSGASCRHTRLIFEGERFDRIHFGAEPIEAASPTTRPCHDCGVNRGGYHHLGCDWERCPRCAGQLISCGCADHNAYLMA